MIPNTGLSAKHSVILETISVKICLIGFIEVLNAIIKLNGYKVGARNLARFQ